MKTGAVVGTQVRLATTPVIKLRARHMLLRNKSLPNPAKSCHDAGMSDGTGQLRFTWTRATAQIAGLLEEAAALHWAETFPGAQV